MKAVANALQISNNAKRVLVQVKPMMHESIQEEIEKVSLLLEGELQCTVHLEDSMKPLTLENWYFSMKCWKYVAEKAEQIQYKSY